MRFTLNSLLITTRRFVKTMVSDLKRGDYIIHNDKVVTIDQVTSVQKGRGCRSFLITTKELPICGPNAPLPAVSSIKPSSKDSFDVVQVRDKTCTFLYRQGQELAMMGPDMEEEWIPCNLFTDSLLELMEAGEKVRLKRQEGSSKVVAALMSNVVRCTVKQVIPQGSSTVAVTVSGGRVVCPPILKPGDQINVDTTNGNYLSRI